MSDAGDDRPDLGISLAGWAGEDAERNAIARTIEVLAGAAIELAALVRRTVLGPGLDGVVGLDADGDPRRQIDEAAHGLLLRALADAPVAAVASRQSCDVTVLRAGAPLLVAVDPLDGSANVSIGAPVGMIFSLRPTPSSVDAVEPCFLRPGTELVGAGLVLFGPATVLVLSVGDGTDVFAFDDATCSFRRITAAVRTPAGTREFAINASNARHWAPTVRAYVDDLTVGSDGPRQADFTMRWSGALVADAYRILTLGGVFLYPGDSRPGHRRGRLRLLYEAQPIAMLLEQAGGAATDGRARILEIAATALDARTPLVFGSADKVARVIRYHDWSPYEAERSPLFAERGLFRS